MNLIELTHPLWSQWGLTLVRFVWQGAAVAALLAVALRLLRQRPPGARYAACGAALLLIMACPIATFTVLRARSMPPIAAADHPSGASVVTLASPSEPGTTQAAASSEAAARSAEPTPNASDIATPAERTEARTVGETAGAALAGSAPVRDRRLATWLSVAALVWMCIVCLLGLRLLGGWLSLHRLRRIHEPLPPNLAELATRLRHLLGVSESVRVLTSRAVRTPVAFGLLKPLVLLPVSLLTQCTPDVLEAIIAHELAHIRRYDLWINLLQRVIETLLFYHPAVWWISSRMRLERELCCDDAAVAVTGRRDVYAHSLLAVSQGAMPHVGILSAAMFTTRITLMTRIRRVLQLPRVPDRTPLWPAGAVSLMAVAALLVIPGVQGSGAGVRGSEVSAQASSTLSSSDGVSPTARTEEPDATAASAPAAQDEVPPKTSLVGTDYKAIESYRDDIELQRRVVSLTTDVLRGYLGFATAVQRGDTAEPLRRFRPEGRAATAEDTAKLRADLQAIGFELQGDALSGHWAVHNIHVTDDTSLALVTPAPLQPHYHGKEWWMQTDFVLVPDEAVGWVVESVSYHERGTYDAFYKRAGAEADQKHLDELIVWAIPLWGKRSASRYQSPYSRSKGVSTTRIGGGRTEGEFVPALRDLDLYAAAGYPGVLADAVPPAVPEPMPQRIKVYSQGDGIIARVPAKAGQQVKKGDLLVQLDDAEITIELEAAKVRLEPARLESEHLKGLHDKQRLVSVEEVVRAETALRLAQIDLQRWELRLARTRITSPADGVVSKVAKEITVGKKLSAGDEVLTLDVPQPTEESAGGSDSAPQP